MDQEVLAEQHYSIDDELRHINWLLHAFHAQRYTKINGRPVLLIYKASALPCAVSTKICGVMKQEDQDSPTCF